jgi:hypothetical protein
MAAAAAAGKAKPVGVAKKRKRSNANASEDGPEENAPDKLTPTQVGMICDAAALFRRVVPHLTQ